MSRKKYRKINLAVLYLTLRFHSSLSCRSLGLSPESSARKSVNKRLNCGGLSIMGKCPKPSKLIWCMCIGKLSSLGTVIAGVFEPYTNKHGTPRLRILGNKLSDCKLSIEAVTAFGSVFEASASADVASGVLGDNQSSNSWLLEVFILLFNEAKSMGELISITRSTLSGRFFKKDKPTKAPRSCPTMATLPIPISSRKLLIRSACLSKV